VDWYGFILRDLTAFLNSRGIQELQGVGTAHLRDFLVHLRQRGQASETIFRTFGGLRCAFSFWGREGYLAKNHMALVEKPRRERVLIRPLTPEQATALLEQPDTSNVEGLRNRAMMMLMLDSGLRVSEITAVEADRIDWLHCTLTVMGKGRKERQVPFSSRTGQALLEYARTRAEGVIRSPHFFLGRTGKALERNKIRKLVHQYGVKAGLHGVRISPHTLRHTFAVLYVRGGGDSFSLQEILGHATLDMTRRYVHLARHDIADQHKKFSPMDTLLGRPGIAVRPSTLGTAAVQNEVLNFGANQL
jgi:site-specific recombinase XerD